MTPAGPRVLLVIDDSDASTRAVSYVARLFKSSRCSAMSFCLGYIMPAPPARFLEFGGSDDPTSERRLVEGLRRRQHEWAASAERVPWQRLSAAKMRLRRAGVDRSCIETYLSSPLDQRNPVEEVLLIARERQCDTIVIGYRAHTWFGVGRDPLAEHLIRDAKGLAVWVID